MVEAVFVKSAVIVNNEKDASRIFNRGKFGDFREGRLYLGLVEALYLLENGRIEISDYRNKKMSFEDVAKRATKIEPEFWTKYVVYRDIRKKGYITKTALKYGADFRIYDKKSSPENSHAPWLLFAVSEREQFDWRKFAAMNRVAHSVKKNLMIAISDEEDSVTYYEVSWKKP